MNEWLEQFAKDMLEMSVALEDCVYILNTYKNDPKKVATAFNGLLVSSKYLKLKAEEITDFIGRK